MLEQLFEAIDLGIVVFDLDFTILRWNRWLALRTKIDQEDAVGRSLFEIVPTLDTSWFRKYCRMVFSFGTHAFLSQKLHHFCIPVELAGSQHTHLPYMQQNCTVGAVRADDLTISGAFLTVQDVTELVLFEERLAKAAEHDGLTGAHNRHSFDKLLVSEYRRHRRYARPLSIIMLDIDHFKHINDTYGHVAGDTVLQSLTRSLSGRIREVDTLFRYGGEEFCIMLPETDSERSRRVAEELRGIVEKMVVHHDDIHISLTASFGVATLTDKCSDERMLLQEADAALYRAKRSGRNRVVHACNRGNST